MFLHPDFNMEISTFAPKEYDGYKNAHKTKQKLGYFRLILFKLKSKERTMQRDMRLNKTEACSEMRTIFQHSVPSCLNFPQFYEAL